MIRSIVLICFGVAMLVCCLGASAEQAILAENIGDGTGITLGLVLGAIGMVAVGGYWLGTYITRQESRIRELERRMSHETEQEDER